MVSNRITKLESKLKSAILALSRIQRWSFATDGRQFRGNHKLVLKEIIMLATNEITAQGRQQRPRSNKVKKIKRLSKS
jgi:hypothetical protein